MADTRTNEELNTAVYKKLSAEEETFRDWLKTLSPDEILHHAYEYVIREDILLNFESNDLSDAQAKVLLNTKDLMSDLFRQYEKLETGYMETMWSCIENRADELLRQQTEQLKVPMYPNSVTYARENGEMEAYSASRKATLACKESIETTIREHYSDNRLHEGGAKKMINTFGADRVAAILAVTCIQRDWDGRISDKAKEWAKSVPLTEDTDRFGEDRNREFALRQTHSGLVDLFVKEFRQEIAVEKTAEKTAVKTDGKEKRPSVLAQLKNPSRDPITDIAKKKETVR